MTKSSSSIGQYVATIKLTVKISSIFVAFLENMKFKCLWTQVISKIITKVVSHPTDFKIEQQVLFETKSRVGFHFKIHILYGI